MFTLIYGPDGIWTRDILVRNQELCPLSYGPLMLRIDMSVIKFITIYRLIHKDSMRQNQFTLPTKQFCLKNSSVMNFSMRSIQICTYHLNGVYVQFVTPTISFWSVLRATGRNRTIPSKVSTSLVRVGSCTIPHLDFPTRIWIRCRTASWSTRSRYHGACLYSIWYGDGSQPIRQPYSQHILTVRSTDISLNISSHHWWHYLTSHRSRPLIKV